MPACATPSQLTGATTHPLEQRERPHKILINRSPVRIDQAQVVHGLGVVLRSCLSIPLDRFWCVFHNTVAVLVQQPHVELSSEVEQRRRLFEPFGSRLVVFSCATPIIVHAARYTRTRIRQSTPGRYAAVVATIYRPSIHIASGCPFSAALLNHASAARSSCAAPDWHQTTHWYTQQGAAGGGHTDPHC